MTTAPRAAGGLPGAGKLQQAGADDLGPYRLGRELGRGGFGTVFEALNANTGESVAVKRVGLTNVRADELDSIESEIRLLTRLQHTNVVKYYESLRTRSYLYIVLELVENGSLSAAVKRFGAFSERLTALYVSQMLRGLIYLGEQGVVHRDLKGANILITKEGIVKLADFGVAVLHNTAGTGAAPTTGPATGGGGTGATTSARGGRSKSRKARGGGEAAASASLAAPPGVQPGGALDVAGSPYWIAPEVIEMKGSGPESDVWSLGATVVELVSGSPPYFDLPPLSALYHIVSDEAVPLPSNISPALADFLGQCFRKEPTFRATPAELLAHPWIVSNLASVTASRVATGAAALDGGGGRGGGGGGAVADRTLAIPLRVAAATAATTAEESPSSLSPSQPPAGGGDGFGAAGPLRPRTAGARPSRPVARSWLNSLKRGDAATAGGVQPIGGVTTTMSAAPGRAGARGGMTAAAAPSGGAAGDGRPATTQQAVDLGPRSEREFQALAAASLDATARMFGGGASAASGAAAAVNAAAGADGGREVPSERPPLPPAGAAHIGGLAGLNRFADDDEDDIGGVGGGSGLVGCIGGVVAAGQLSARPATAGLPAPVRPLASFVDDDASDELPLGGGALQLKSPTAATAARRPAPAAAPRLPAPDSESDDMWDAAVAAPGPTAASAGASATAGGGGTDGDDLASALARAGLTGSADLKARLAQRFGGGAGTLGRVADDGRLSVSASPAGSAASGSSYRGTGGAALPATHPPSGHHPHPRSSMHLAALGSSSTGIDRLSMALATAGGGRGTLLRPSPTGSAGSGGGGGAADLALDPFAAFDVHDFSVDPRAEALRAQQREVEALAERITAEAAAAANPPAVRAACQDLIGLFREAPPTRTHFIRTHGALQLVDTLQSCATALLVASGAAVPLVGATLPASAGGGGGATDGSHGHTVSSYTHADAAQAALMTASWVLRVVNELAGGDAVLLESLALVGVLPAALQFAAPCYPSPVRSQAAQFARQLASASRTALQLFVACGGTHVLVALLTPSPRPHFALEALAAMLDDSAAAGGGGVGGAGAPSVHVPPGCPVPDSPSASAASGRSAGGGDGGGSRSHVSPSLPPRGPRGSPLRRKPSEFAVTTAAATARALTPAASAPAAAPTAADPLAAWEMSQAGSAVTSPASSAAAAAVGGTTLQQQLPQPRRDDSGRLSFSGGGGAASATSGSQGDAAGAPTAGFPAGYVGSLDTVDLDDMLLLLASGRGRRDSIASADVPSFRSQRSFKGGLAGAAHAAAAGGGDGASDGSSFRSLLAGGDMAALQARFVGEEASLVATAVRGVLAVFALQTTQTMAMTPNEFRRMFVKGGLLPPLATALRCTFLYVCSQLTEAQSRAAAAVTAPAAAAATHAGGDRQPSPAPEAAGAATLPSAVTASDVPPLLGYCFSDAAAGQPLHGSDRGIATSRTGGSFTDTMTTFTTNGSLLTSSSGGGALSLHRALQPLSAAMSLRSAPPRSFGSSLGVGVEGPVVLTGGGGTDGLPPLPPLPPAAALPADAATPPLSSAARPSPGPSTPAARRSGGGGGGVPTSDTAAETDYSSDEFESESSEDGSDDEAEGRQRPGTVDASDGGLHAASNGHGNTPPQSPTADAPLPPPQLLSPPLAPTTAPTAPATTATADGAPQAVPPAVVPLQRFTSPRSETSEDSDAAAAQRTTPHATPVAARPHAPAGAAGRRGFFALGSGGAADGAGSGGGGTSQLCTAGSFLPSTAAGAAAAAATLPPFSAAVGSGLDNLAGITDVLVLFAQGDAAAKNALAAPATGLLTPLLRMLRPAPYALLHHPRYGGAVVTRALKTLRYVSMDPDALDVLDGCGAIQVLVPFLLRETGLRPPHHRRRQEAPAASATASATGAPPLPPTVAAAGRATPAASATTSSPLHSKDVQSVVLHTLFNLCRVNKARQQAAAVAGIVPALQEVVASAPVLKPLAVPLLCDMAYAGTRARAELTAAGAHDTLLGLLGTEYWHVHALNALATWVGSSSSMCGVLAAPPAVDALVGVFRSASVYQEAVLPPLLAVADRCPDVAGALAGRADFMDDLTDRLARPGGRAILTKHLLGLLRAVVAAAPRPADLLAEWDLPALVAGVASRLGDKVMLLSITDGLLRDFAAVAASSSAPADATAAAGGGDAAAAGGSGAQPPATTAAS